MTRHLRRLGRFLDDGGPIAQLVREARDRSSLLESVREALPADAAARCVAAGLEHGHLRLTVDSPVWATRVRYMGREIGRRLATRGLGVDRVTVQAEPRQAGAAADHVAAPSLSTAAARCVDALAQGTDDEELRAALQRLARRGRGSGAA